MWLNFFNFDLKIIRQGSVFIICKKSLKILTLSMLKHAEMVCQKSADPGSPRVKHVPQVSLYYLSKSNKGTHSSFTSKFRQKVDHLTLF